MHLASAVVGEADVFCTVDKQLYRRGRTLETRKTAVLTPLELVHNLDS